MLLLCFFLLFLSEFIRSGLKYNLLAFCSIFSILCFDKIFLSELSIFCNCRELIFSNQIAKNGAAAVSQQRWATVWKMHWIYEASHECNKIVVFILKERYENYCQLGGYK